MVREQKYVCFVSPGDMPYFKVREKVVGVEDFDVRKLKIPPDAYKLYFFKKVYGNEGGAEIESSRIRVGKTYFINGTVLNALGVLLRFRGPQTKSIILKEMEHSGCNRIVVFNSGRYELFREGDELIKI